MASLSPERIEELAEQLLVQCDLFEQASLKQKCDALLAVASTVSWESRVLAKTLNDQLGRMEGSIKDREAIALTAWERIASRLQVELTPQGEAARIAASAKREVTGGGMSMNAYGITISPGKPEAADAK